MLLKEYFQKYKYLKMYIIYIHIKFLIFIRIIKNLFIIYFILLYYESIL